MTIEELQELSDSFKTYGRQPESDCEISGTVWNEQGQVCLMKTFSSQEIGVVVDLIDAEIARQSVSDQDVQRVMYEMEDKIWQSWENGYPIRLSDNDAELIRTALRQMKRGDE